jgi:hypothetical protein
MRSHTAADDSSGADADANGDDCCTSWPSLLGAFNAIVGGCNAEKLWEVMRPASRRSARPKPRKRHNIRLRKCRRGAVIWHIKRRLRLKNAQQPHVASQMSRDEVHDVTQC